MWSFSFCWRVMGVSPRLSVCTVLRRVLDRENLSESPKAATLMRATSGISDTCGASVFLARTINLWAGETKNDAARTIPLVPQLRALLIEQRAKRQPDCPYVCFRLDSKGHAVKVGSFRKAWQSRCVKLGLGRMEPAADAVTGEVLYAPPRGPRSKPKAKMVYRGMIFHDLRGTGVRNLVRAGVSEKVAQTISSHKTRAVFERYDIVSQNDVAEAGRKLAAFQDNGDKAGTSDAPTLQGNATVN
jgi:hypothetical protein